MTLRRTLLALLPALAVLSLLAVLAADAAGGDNLVLLDAGPLARIGAPVAANLADLAAALTLGGAVVAETRDGWRVLETSHPPTYYFPPTDVAQGVLGPVVPAPGGRRR